MPQLSAEHKATQVVANRLTELCSSGQNVTAISELYDDQATHEEVMDGPGATRLTRGKQTLMQNAERFAQSITVHGSTIGKPVVNGDQFILPMSLDCTFKDGPMAGQRFNMIETVLYTVKNGKITHVKFFYGFDM